jgi:hypothetical protein
MGEKAYEDVLARYPVYNHNPFGNCVAVGKTKTYHTEVYVNEEDIRFLANQQTPLKGRGRNQHHSGDCGG